MKPDHYLENSSMMPVRIIFIFSVVLVGVLLVSGCDEMPNNDIVIVKLTPNATMEWSKVIDSGMNDRAFQIIETPDNNFVISYQLSGPDFIGLMKITNGKDIAWKQSVLEKGCGHLMIIGRNGDIITFGGQNICRINDEGAVFWNRTTKMNGYAQSLLETPDNGYIVGGGKTDWYETGIAILYDEYGNITPQLSEQEKRKKGIPITQTTVARLDANGNVIWQTFLGQENCRDPATILIHLDNDQGYVVHAGEKIIRLDENGKFIKVTHIDTVSESDVASLPEHNLKKYLTDLRDPVLFARDPPEFLFYNPHGEAVAKKILKNASVAIDTNDGGYISAGFPGKIRLSVQVLGRAQDSNLYVVKLKPDGSKEWDTAVHGVLVNSISWIIQTSDGGYVLMCGNDKRWDKS